MEAVGPKPDPSYMLDRIDNEGHYEKGNVRWVPRSINMLNSRVRKDKLTSSLRGVGWHGKGWVARFQDQWIGTFPTEEAASKAYWERRNEYEKTVLGMVRN